MNIALEMRHPFFEEGISVTRLHMVLEYLWESEPPVIPRPAGGVLTAFNREKSDSDYGPSTKELVRQVRKEFGLPDSEEVDYELTVIINERLSKDGKIALITGQLVDASKEDHPPLNTAGLLVVANTEVHNEFGKQLPWRAECDNGGKFTIYLDWDEEAETNQRLHIQLHVFSSSGDIWIASSDKYFNAIDAKTKSLDDVKIAVQPSFVPVYEYDIVYQNVRIAKKAVGLGDEEAFASLQPSNVAEIVAWLRSKGNESFNISGRQVEHLILSHLLQETASKNFKISQKFEQQFYYGLLRTQKLCFLNWSSIPTARTEIRLADYSRPINQDSKDSNEKSRISLLSEIAFYSEFSGEKNYSVSDEKALAKAISDPLKELIVPNHYLDAEHGEMKPEFRKWLAQIRQHMVSDKKTLKRAPREPFHHKFDGSACNCDDVVVDANATRTEKTTISDVALGELLAAKQLPVRYADLASSIQEVQNNSESDSALNNFNLLTANGLVVANQRDMDQSDAKALLAMQRVARLTTNPVEVKFLLEADPSGRGIGIDSAWKVRQLGRTRFRKAYLSHLSDDGSQAAALRSNADKLFEAAVQRAESVSHLVGEMHALGTAQHVEALCSVEDREAARGKLKNQENGTIREGLPSWESLFGSLDACACEHCNSIYGPGSYLVDVLQYFKRLDRSDDDDNIGIDGKQSTDAKQRKCLAAPNDAKTVFDVLMSRRPDIGYLDLNCSNSNTDIPYIDLVNELLEDQISRQVVETTRTIATGKIDAGLLNWLNSNGFPEISDEARITEDSKDNLIVRDNRAVVLFDRLDAKEVECPRWLVSRLRQTFGTAEEIGALPEYVNEDAISTLIEAHNSLKLPFNSNQWEAEAYLKRLGTDRASVMQTFAKWSEHNANQLPDSTRDDDRLEHKLKVATQLLSLTPADREIITCPAPGKQHEFWGGKENTQTVREMTQLSHFLDRTHLKTEPVEESPLDELLAGHFVNPCGTKLRIVSREPSLPASRCDTSKMDVQGLDSKSLDRINRLLRLHRKTGWSINLLDRLIMSPAIGNGELDEQCLVAMADIISLATDINHQVVEIASWFADLSTFGKRSLYRRLFLQRENYDSSVELFRPENLSPPEFCKDETGGKGNSKTIGDLQNEVARLIGASNDDLELLLFHHKESGKAAGKNEATGIDADAALSLWNLSRVWGWFQFARKLRLEIKELLQLLRLLGISDVLASPGNALRVQEATELLRKWQLTADDVLFWLRHEIAEGEVRQIPDAIIVQLLLEMKKGFEQIELDRTDRAIIIRQASGDDDDPESRPKSTEPPSATTAGDGMVECLEKLDFGLSQITELSVDDRLLFKSLLEHRETDDRVKQLQDILNDKPLNKYPGLVELAKDELVTKPNLWLEESIGANPSSHFEHQKWCSDYLVVLLDALDQETRKAIVIQTLSTRLPMPIEQLTEIVRLSRLPIAGIPAVGGSILATLSNPAWAIVPDDGDQDRWQDLWQAVFADPKDNSNGMTDNQKRFREGVLSDQALDNWDSPPAKSEAELFRSILAQLFIAVRLAHKIATISEDLKLVTTEQLSWGLWFDPTTTADKNRLQQLGWFSFDQTPLTPPLSDDGLSNLFEQLALLLDGLEFIGKYPRPISPELSIPKPGAIDILELALREPQDPRRPISDVVQLFSRLVDIDIDILNEVADWLVFPRAAFRQAEAYRYLNQAYGKLRQLHLHSEHLELITDEFSGANEEEERKRARELVIILRHSLNQHIANSTFLKSLKEIQDPLRELKRDALVAYLISDPQHGCFQMVNDIYDHLLIDPQMSACMPTSRIVQAHAVTQLFAQRCLMGQEPSVDPRADDDNDGDWREWHWMRNYRVWEANRKVFLYPENWIEPELRDDKSEFFKELEQTLSQSEITDNSVELAARAYLDKLDDAAFMEVMAAFYQDSEHSENGKNEGRVLHVVARTKGGDPAIYYYRRFRNESEWTSWEKIDLDITTDHLILFASNGRLNLAWPIFEDVSNDEKKYDFSTGGNQKVRKSPRGWKIQLAISERSSGKWQPKRASLETLNLPYTRGGNAAWIIANDDEMDKSRRRCRFFVRNFDSGEEIVSSNRLDETENLGIVITVHGFFREEGVEEKELKPSPKHSLLIGGFLLADCKGNPEVLSSAELPESEHGIQLTVPTFLNTELNAQRWVEQKYPNVKTDKLSIKGLTGFNGSSHDIFDQTPGTFRITAVQQNTIVDSSIGNFLKINDEEPPDSWASSGTMAPFFYEDGRQGYVALPKTRINSGIPANEYDYTISDIMAPLSLLSRDIAYAAKSGKIKWAELVEKWKADDKKKVAFSDLERMISKSCFGLEFHAFHHPFICLMKESLSAGGFERLMNLSSVEWKSNNEFEKKFAPNSKIVLKPYPAEHSSFKFDPIDSYASYNWEMFYHLPALISKKLAVSQNFEDAFQWYHYIFNPAGVQLSNEVYSSWGELAEVEPPKGPGKYWVTKPFRRRSIDQDPNLPNSYVGQRIETILDLLMRQVGVDNDVLDHWKKSVAEWRRNPFVPHQIARGRTVAFQKATFMRYLDALIQWADHLFRRDTRESVNAALQLYITAERLLGPRPRIVKAPGASRSQTFRELEDEICGEAKNVGIDSFGNSLVLLENVLPADKQLSNGNHSIMPSLPAASCLTAPYFCIPTNDKLLEYWDVVEDRLFKVRNCQNIEGVERQLALFAPPIDPALLVRAFAAGLSIGDVLSQGAGEVPQYRFQLLSQKATELVQMVISLGNSLLQAIEKKDAEAIAKLRNNHELNLLELTREIKISQIQEAQNTLESLRRTKQVMEARRDYYQNISYISSNEERALSLNEEGTSFETAALALNTAANVAHMLPNFSMGGWGFGGAPGTQVDWGGVNVGNALSAMGQFLGGLGSLKRSAAGAVSTLAGYERRWEDWKLQENLANRELRQIDHQIAAAEIRVDIFQTELKNHDKQTEQSAEVLQYMKDRKFSNEELYDWMISQVSSTYFQSWQLAHRFALRVERAFHFELGPKDNGEQFSSYVRMDSWDSLHKGLHAGDRLLLDLKRMETDYLDRNRREFEITKHVSLVRLNPDAFLALKRGEGTCEFELPEILFDLDYPGHYFRRLKSVSVSIPCVVGPYAGIHCTLTLTKSKIRIKNKVDIDEADEQNLLRNYSRIQSVATSSGQNDSGMFDLNFRDDRYLPFEGAGADSTWTLELQSKDNRELDFSSLSDIILHFNYTSRFGGKKFQEERRTAAGEHLIKTPTIHRLFILPEEFPTEWYRFENDKNNENDNTRTLILDGLSERLPYFTPTLSNVAASIEIHQLDDPDKIIRLELEGSQGYNNKWENVQLSSLRFKYDKTGDIPPIGLVVSLIPND